MTTSKLRAGTGLIAMLALGAAGLTGVLAADEPLAVAEPTQKDVRYAMSFRGRLRLPGQRVLRALHVPGP